MWDRTRNVRDGSQAFGLPVLVFTGSHLIVEKKAGTPIAHCWKLGFESTDSQSQATTVWRI